MAATALCVVGLPLVAATVFYLSVQIPAAHADASAQVTIVYYSDGRTEIGRFGPVDRESVPLSTMPVSLRNAVLVAEDRDFYGHGAVSPTGLLRAIWAGVRGHELQGGSTITQQLVKNLYLTPERSLSRKLSEVVIAAKLERSWSKDRILEQYLNTVYFGRRAYGVQAAARAYFGKDAARLSAAEGAVLAAVIRAPAGYAPERHDAALRSRWAYVLAGEVAKNWLTRSAAAAMRFPAIRPRSDSVTHGTDGFLLAYVRAELSRAGLATDRPENLGLRVVTTFDRTAQERAVAAVSGARLHGRPNSGLHVGLVAEDPRTGALRALYGGADFARPQFLDDATQARVETGSGFQVVTLVAALGHGFAPGSTWDGRNRREIPDGPGQFLIVHNHLDKDLGRSIRLDEAFALGSDVVFADLATRPRMGTATLASTAESLGVRRGAVAGHPAETGLGNARVTALELTRVVATIADGGRRVEPTALTSVTRADGSSVPLPAREVVRAVPAAVARAAVQAMIGPARLLAGKTGITDSGFAAWYTGFTLGTGPGPSVVATVVLFRTRPDGRTRISLSNAAGAGPVKAGSLPARIWADFTAAFPRRS